MNGPKPAARDRTKQIGTWFLGPKAENASLEEEMIQYILRDYFHWRRNYYPSDEITITQRMRREALEWTDALFQQLTEMLARLRRHFPFYSPRYIAHMLSDQTIPSVLGYFAGMLYNPNNVTPEAAPVTVEWELEVAADILRMLDYQAPPATGSHHRETRKEFGWAHITGGGTVANLEALWVARNVRYFPLAAREAACKHKLNLAVKLPGTGGPPTPLSKLDERQCLGIRPNSATFLLLRFIEAVRQRWNLSDTEASGRAWEMLRETGLSLADGGALACFAKWPPALFVSGTAHYSVLKSADILGFGKDNVVLVDVDRVFRLDLRDLEQKVKAALGRGQFPLAVVAIAGTTEEGSVDPVHGIDDFRRRFEEEAHTSFWLHVDAAWAGYIRSLFIGENGPGGSEAERIDQVNRFASRKLEIRQGRYARAISMMWGSKHVARSFLAFPRAESIVVDPHKMGYIPYPCGVVAFRNDRVRHFLTQQAPYITPADANVPARQYNPPASIGPFILEGSKPGASAAACWLSHRMIPPNRAGYGEIARASLLAARELYERLIHWEHAAKANRTEIAYRFVPVADAPPDTNIVCFVVAEKGSRSLARMNRLAEMVYGRLTIQADAGAGGYSYLQPFFLSRTRFQLPNYSEHAVADLLRRAGAGPAEYPTEGIFILRATVMTPYITLAAETGHSQCLLSEFMQVLAATAEEAVARLTRLVAGTPAEGGECQPQRSR